jgi:hypothetical protein
MSKRRGKAGKPKNFIENGNIIFQTGKIKDKENSKNYKFFNDPGAGITVTKDGDYKYYLVEIETTSLLGNNEGFEMVLEKAEKFATEGKFKKFKKLTKKLKKKRGEKVAVDLEDDK